MANRHYLTSLKDGIPLRSLLAGKKVRIWSGEHRAWWRENGRGYTDRVDRAGVYEFEDAWRSTNGCGPEKAIAYDPVEPPV